MRTERWNRLRRRRREGAYVDYAQLEHNIHCRCMLKRECLREIVIELSEAHIIITKAKCLVVYQNG